MRTTTYRQRATRLAAIAVSATFLLAACGADEPTSEASDDDNADAAASVGTEATTASAADAPADGSREVVAFVRTSSDTYQAAWQRGMKKVAEANDIDLKFIENNADQTEQTNQVQQQLNSGNEPDAWVWMPTDAQAGVATLKSLHDSEVPVFQVNGLPPEGTEQYVTAYAGVNDIINGRTSGELIVEARNELVERGDLGEDEAAKIAYIKFFAGYQPSIDRLAGAEEVMEGHPFEVVAEAIDAVDVTTGFDATSTILPILQEQGVDIVYAQNDAGAAGAIQALTDGGFTPGEDVLVVGGNCRDDVSMLLDGRQFGTGLQAAELEGEFTMQMIVNYLDNPTVLDGEYEAPATPDSVPEWPEAISKYNFLPNPPVRGDEVESTKLWGQAMTDLCAY